MNINGFIIHYCFRYLRLYQRLDILSLDFKGSLMGTHEDSILAQDRDEEENLQLVKYKTDQSPHA